jgi:hypothetical protein
VEAPYLGEKRRGLEFLRLQQGWRRERRERDA